MPIEVKDVMGRVAIAVPADASFADIVAAMKRFAVGAVTVIDADRRPMGPSPPAPACGRPPG
ncbi:CBS domain-containing protein [Nonomuraea rubra]|uniref:CBS domain-containing protein n=1 Tax=Nonomuraea rubra TaxID=46180 RepID=UPI0034043DFB